MTIKELVKKIKVIEKKENRIVGGREIDKIFGMVLDLENWTDFHYEYNSYLRLK